MLLIARSAKRFAVRPYRGSVVDQQIYGLVGSYGLDHDRISVSRLGNGETRAAA